MNPRKSLKVLALHGTYRPDRHASRNPPKVELAKNPRPPVWLKDKGAKKLFAGLSKQLIAAGIFTDLDIDHLALYCGLLFQVTENLEAGGEVRPSLIAVVRGMAADLGLTPISRERLSVKPVQTEANEFDGI